MSPSFHLAVDSDGIGTLTFDLSDRKVNLFTRESLTELEEVIQGLSKREDIKCLVLLSGKDQTFIAGADIDEIANVTDPEEAHMASRVGQRLFAAWGDLPFPTIAAVRGTCLGGGTELALASTYILVSDRKDLRIGLPEVRLGIVPAWGGCSRLPLRIGITAALDIILAGKAVPGKKAFKVGLADRLMPDASFARLVSDFASGVATGTKSTRRGSGVKELVLEKNPLGRKILFDQARKRVLARTGGHYPAPLRAIEVIKVAVESGLEAGFEAEARATAELAISQVAKNLIHVFRLMEASKRNGNEDLQLQPIRQAAVLGAGVMGGGIAQLIAQRADLPVRIRDLAPEPLAQGMAHASKLFKKLVKRRRLSKVDAIEKMALLRPTLSYSGLGTTDLVIEAVVENLEIKQKVFAEVAKVTPPDAILASNTSSLSIDLISRDTPQRERVVGMHFFHPVHKMPLVEVIAGPKSSREAVATVVAFARTLGKTPIMVKDAPGFLINRLLMFYMAEATWLLTEGHRIEDIDSAMTDWGMPLGPMALTDEVGIDVGAKVAHILGAAFEDRLELAPGLDVLAEAGRLGAKSHSGLYVYQSGKRTKPDPEVYRLLGLNPNDKRPNPSRLVDRMILPMVNEAARCLDEGVVGSPGELDLALIMGTGFPPFRGGLCRWADQQGLKELGEVMARLVDEVGERFRPSESFQRAAESGGFYTEWK